MTIRKLRAGRVPTVTASTWVGERGTMFYDEDTGQLKVSNGTTPGGHFVNPPVATASQLGGIKAGAGANVSVDGTLTIDTTGLPLSIGDLSFIQANISSVNANEDINIFSNGTGAINLVGNLHVHATGVGGLSASPIFQINADGQAKFLVPLADSVTGAVEIIGALDGVYQVPVNTGVMLHVTGNPPTDAGVAIPSRVYNDSQAIYALYAGRRYNGTAASPTQIKSGDTIVRYAGTGYANNGWPSFGSARFEVVADEDFTGAGQGGHLAFFATPTGKVASTANTTVVANMSATSGLTVYGNVTAGNVSATNLTNTFSTINTNIASLATGANANTAAYLTTATGNISAGNIAVGTNGRITTPKVIINDGGIRTISGGTTCTIDFAVDSLILWTAPSGTAAITLSNYTAGAKVKLIIALTTTHDITYGISSAALSSTGSDNWNGAGAGSVDISNTAVHLEYTCFSGVAGGCYVAVTAN